MNKTKIDWATMSWNPLTGCRHGCPYCYARRTAHRFDKGLEDPAPLSGGLHVLEEKIKGTPYPYGFEPTLHRYVCQACGAVITDQHKGKMLEAGRWEYVRKSAEHPKSVAYWINTLYSPFTRFSEIAYEFMKSKDDPELLQNFTNSWLAEPWEDTRLKTNADLVMERQTDVPAWELPEWTKLLTGGIDVQENCLYWTIRAWGDFMTSQNVAHGQALSMAEVERVMNTEFKLPSGEKMMVELALMDSGDQTDEVYNFCISNYDWVRPCKGSSTPLQGHYRISTVDKAGSQANGMQLVIVDGGKYKDMIAARMRRPNGRGSWMVHKDAVDELAEVLEYGRKKGIDMGGVIFGTGATAARQGGPGSGQKPGDPEHGGDPGQGGKQPDGGGEQPQTDN